MFSKFTNFNVFIHKIYMFMYKCCGYICINTLDILVAAIIFKIFRVFWGGWQLSFSKFSASSMEVVVVRLYCTVDLYTVILGLCSFSWLMFLAISVINVLAAVSFLDHFIFKENVKVCSISLLVLIHINHKCIELLDSFPRATALGSLASPSVPCVLVFMITLLCSPSSCCSSVVGVTGVRAACAHSTAPILSVTIGKEECVREKIALEQNQFTAALSPYHEVEFLLL